MCAIVICKRSSIICITRRKKSLRVAIAADEPIAKPVTIDCTTQVHRTNEQLVALMKINAKPKKKVRGNSKKR